MDDWLDGNSRPGDANIKRLADLLATCGAGDAEETAREIRGRFSLEAMYSALADIVGNEHAFIVVDRLIGYANEVPVEMIQRATRRAANPS